MKFHKSFTIIIIHCQLLSCTEIISKFSNQTPDGTEEHITPSPINSPVRNNTCTTEEACSGVVDQAPSQQSVMCDADRFKGSVQGLTFGQSIKVEDLTLVFEKRVMEYHVYFSLCIMH